MEETSIIGLDMLHLSSPADLIDQWKPRRLLAEALNVETDAVHKWAQNKRIPPKYHFAVLAAAKAAGIDVSADDLVRLHADKPANASHEKQGPASETVNGGAGLRDGAA